MKLVVGLGNPGERYQNNRHNVGFHFVDYIAQVHSSSFIVNGDKTPFKFDKYLMSEIYELRFNRSELTTKNNELLLAKPQTFMNLSGNAVRKLLANVTLPASDLIVVHDELDLALGDFKINKTGSPLHNGIASIEKALGTKDFTRVRIGVDNRNPQNRMEGEKYVLSDFLPAEKEKIIDVFPTVYERLVNTITTDKERIAADQ